MRSHTYQFGLLAKYGIIYMMRKIVKGSTIAEHLANNATNDYQLLSFDFHE
jgi:hypothetical protein